MSRRPDPLIVAADTVQEDGPWTIGTTTFHRLPCCVFTGLTLQAWAGVSPDDPYWGTSSEWWADLNIWDGERPWSPIQAASALGDEVDEPQIGRWHLVQLWKGAEDGTVDAGDRGHQVLMLRLTTTGLVLVVDSTESRGFRWVVWDLEAYLASWGETWGGPVTARYVRLSLPLRLRQQAAAEQAA
jgi:hypothetical protein